MPLLLRVSESVQRHDEFMNTIASQMQQQQQDMQRAFDRRDQAEAERERVREAQRSREVAEREELERARSASLIDEMRRLLVPLRPELVQAAETPAPVHPPTPSARTAPTFHPRAVPDTAPRPNYNFNFQVPSATRANPIPISSLPFEHPPNPALAASDEQEMLKQWGMLVDSDPLQVSSLYQESPFYETILQVLRSNSSIAGNVWHNRVLHLESTVLQWALSRMQLKKTSIHHKLRCLTDLTNLKFPKTLTSSTADEAAKGWDKFRLQFIRNIESALLIGCESMEIFRALIASASDDAAGNPKLMAFLLDLVEDYALNRNSPLACDVLMRKADHSFSIGAAGYSQESASIAWDRMFERPEGVDSVEASKTLTRAFVQRQGDKAGINVRTVWEHANMAHDINDRFIQVLTNDLASRARGLDNSMKFKELLAAARIRVQNGEARPHEASCVHICQNFLGPYEESRASLYKKSQIQENSKQTRGVNNVKWQTPENASTQSKLPSDGSDLTAMVAALQSQFNTLQTTMRTQLQEPRQTPTPLQTPSTPPAAPNDYRRVPAPSSYSRAQDQTTADSPYPTVSIAFPFRPPRRNCSYPSGGQGLPANSGSTEWNADLWGRARARFYSYGKYAAHPVVSRALAHCRPCDATMTKPRVDDLRRDVTQWTNETGCAYCAFRPLAPPNTALADEWKYGTGDGAHNPVVCKPYIRYLCEAGAGEFPADEEVKKLIRSLVSLKPVA
jgi:hypothetical protein